MGRPATGNVKHRNGAQGLRWYARITLESGERSPWLPLSADIKKDDEPGARAAALVLSKDTRERGGVRDSVKMTVEEYAKEWLKDREGRVKSIRSDRARMRDHVLPLIALDDVRTIGRTRIELVRDDLDRKIGRGELAWKTAANCWTACTSLFDEAVNSKKSALRVRQDNPCRDVRAPDRGAKKQKQYLHPSEVLAFLTCERIPLRWRRALAVGVYTFARDGELLALRCDAGDIDVVHGTLSITRAYNQQTKRIEQTKSGDTRRFPIEPSLMPLLEVMHDEAGGKGPVLSLAPQGNMARKLRTFLKRAGVTRPELHEPSPTRKPMTWHDARATGITFMAIRGDAPADHPSQGGTPRLRHEPRLHPRGREHARGLRRSLPAPARVPAGPLESFGSGFGIGSARLTIPREFPCGSVPKEGLEPSRPFGRRILNPLRLPFRHFGFCYVVARTYSLPDFGVNRVAAAFAAV